MINEKEWKEKMISMMLVERLICTNKEKLSLKESQDLKKELKKRKKILVDLSPFRNAYLEKPFKAVFGD